MDPETTDPFRSGFRTVRRLSPPGSPWPASATVLEDGAAGMLVDVAELRDWPGWDMRAGAHVLTPIDVIRRQDGHDAVLAACTERLNTVLARRRGGGRPVTVGETVTIAVSVVRGLRELASPPRTTSRGRWWVTPEGRPMFVLGPGESAAEESAAILRALRAGADADDLSAALDAAVEAMSDVRRFRLAADDLDDALVAAGSPAPLDLRRTAAVTAERIDRPAPASPHGREPASVGGVSFVLGLRARLAERLDRLRAALLRLRRARAEGSARRGGPLILVFGGVAAAAVLLMLLWPGTGPADARHPSAPPTDAATPSSPAPLSPSSAAPLSSSAVPSSPSSEGAGPPDLAAVASDILASRRRCGSDVPCLAGVVEDTARSVASGAVDLPTEERTVTALDSFGGVAVVRVEDRADRMPDQLVVIVARNDRWLLRDVHDAAEQPS